MRSLGLSFGAFAILVFLLAGCGGGGGGESTAAATSEATEPPALSKAELITQGDAICAEVNAAVGAAGSTSSDAGETVVQVAGLYGGMVERLKGLGPPREEAAGYSEFISSAEELAQAEDNVKLAYEREETEELTSASTEVASTLTAFESAAGEFGFEKCAEAPTAPAQSAAGRRIGRRRRRRRRSRKRSRRSGARRSSRSGARRSAAGRRRKRRRRRGCRRRRRRRLGGTGGSSGGIGPG